MGRDVATDRALSQSAKYLGSVIPDVRGVVIDEVLQNRGEKFLERRNETLWVLVEELCSHLGYDSRKKLEYMHTRFNTRL